ncbi:Fe(3+) ABC transporter substrate-binding protein [Gammaproteobacteria bacterium]|nr:Fe(3+) ABC transporter substrate-binding protein [Gammaproteobacteria bacterium]
MKIMKMGNRLACTLIFFMAISGISSGAEVNVYSARGEDLIKPALDTFTEQTGIKVNLITESADALIRRIELEGANSPADVLLTVDAGRLFRAKEAGILASLKSPILTQRIPSAYRDPDNQWFGLSLRSRVIMFDKSRVSAEEISSYEDLADPKWKGEICIRSSGNIYNQSLLASLIEHHGEEATEVWAEGLVSNMARRPQGGDRDQIRAAVAGQCKLAVANTYYLAGMLNSDVDTDVEVAQKIGVLWPNQDNRGAHMNVSGAGLIKGSKNVEEARQLIEFLSDDYAQGWYSEVNNEYSVRADIPVSTTLQGFGPFKADQLNLEVLGKNNEAAVRLADRAGWQ